MVTKEKIDAIKEYLKQIELETMEMADRLKLDAQRRWGLEEKFKKAYAELDIKEPEDKPKVAKIDMKSGIKKMS